MAAEGDDQVQSLSAPLLNLETPDPAIAEGLEVFDQKGSVMGRLTEVVDRGGERFAIVSPVQWTTNEQRTVTVPYKSLKVVNGIVTYSPE
jgi:hypothetical protein